jgi:hypothetical protein
VEVNKEQNAWQSAENEKDRALSARQGAKDRATSYVNSHMREPFDSTADFTGGASEQLKQFGDNAYKPKGFQPIDFND